jgi:transcriptional regulator with XRE-family HTH domain
MTDNETFVFSFCDRLRKLRRRMNLNIEDVAERCGLTFNQIQRLEGDIRMKDNKPIVKKSGANGTVLTILTLLNFYGNCIKSVGVLRSCLRSASSICVWARLKIPIFTDR